MTQSFNELVEARAKKMLAAMGGSPLWSLEDFHDEARQQLILEYFTRNEAAMIALIEGRDPDAELIAKLVEALKAADNGLMCEEKTEYGDTCGVTYTCYACQKTAQINEALALGRARLDTPAGGK